MKQYKKLELTQLEKWKRTKFVNIFLNKGTNIQSQQTTQLLGCVYALKFRFLTERETIHYHSGH